MNTSQTCTHCFQTEIYSRTFVLESMDSPVGHQGLHMPEVQLVLQCSSGLGYYF